MNYVFEVRREELPQVLDYYEGFQRESEQSHILAFFQTEGVTCTVFTSLKVMLQGEEAYEDYLMFSSIFGFTPVSKEAKSIVQPTSKTTRFLDENVVGSDEVGTGDFFGPVVVTSAYVTKEDKAFLQGLGVQDSKKISDDKILEIAPQIALRLSHKTLVLPNPKFNQLTQEGYNMNKIKAYLHNHAILKLLAEHPGTIDHIVIDEFCAPNLYYSYLEGRDVAKNITFMQKAEDQVLAVAAASILARERFLLEMEQLSKQYGIVLPKGAGIAVDLIGKRIALEKGFEIFNNIAKTNFKNLEKIKGMM